MGGIALATIGRATSRGFALAHPDLARKTLRTPQTVRGANMSPRRAGSDFANSFEQFWSGLVPSQDRLRTPGPGAYSNSDAGLQATSSFIRPPVVQMPPRLPATQLPGGLVSVMVDSTPGVGQYDLDDGIGGRKWRAQHSRPGGGLPTSSVSHRGSSALARAAQSRMREHRAEAARSHHMMTSATMRLADVSRSVIADAKPEDPGKPSPRSAIIGTDGLHNFDTSSRLGYRTGWVTGLAHTRQLRESRTGPGGYDTERGLSATGRGGTGGFARFAKSGGRQALPTFSRCARFGSERSVGTMQSVHVQSREARTEHFIRTRPMTTTAHGHAARIERAHKLAHKPVGGVSFRRRKAANEAKDHEEAWSAGDETCPDELGQTGMEPHPRYVADEVEVEAAAAGAAAVPGEVEEDGGGAEAGMPAAVPELDLGRLSRGGTPGGSARRRQSSSAAARAALGSAGTGAAAEAARNGGREARGAAAVGGRRQRGIVDDDVMSVRGAAWADEVMLGLADTYARHEVDFVSHNKQEVAAASMDPEGKLPSQKHAHKLDERLAAFKARREGILKAQREHHEQLKRDYDLKLVRKQQRLWLAFVIIASRAHRMQMAVRGKRAERVSVQVLRALGLHKQRVFRAWAAWVKHKRLLWATTVFKARLRPVVRRFRIASRMRKVGVMIDFLKSVQDMNNAVRGARIFYTRILKLQAFWKECLSTLRAQKALLRKQFLRAGLAIRVQGLKRRLRHERRKSEVDKQLVVLARRQAQEEERARVFLKRQQFWAAQSGSTGSDDDEVGALGAGSVSGRVERGQKPPGLAPPPPARGRRLVGRPTPSRAGARAPHRPDAGAAASGSVASDAGRSVSLKRAERHKRRDSIEASIQQTEMYLAATEEALRSLGVIKRARRKSTVVADGAELVSEAAIGGSRGTRRLAHDPDALPRVASAEKAGHGPDDGGSGMGGASTVDSAEKSRRRRSIFRADGDEDTEWETILAKVISQNPPKDVEAEAEKELLDMADGAAAAGMVLGDGAASPARPHRPPAALQPPPSPVRPVAPAGGRRVSAAGPGTASLTTEERRARAVVVDLPMTRAEAAHTEEASGSGSARKGPPRTRRLSIEMAVMRVRTLEEWPPIPEARLDHLLSGILRRHRKTHHRAMDSFREKLREWELGFEAELRKAETRIACIRNRKMTKAEKAAIREYLKARRPLPPRFLVLEPWSVMLDIVRDAMIEQRQLDAHMTQ